MNRVEESRREVEVRLADVRAALRSEFGRAPRRRVWLIGLLAGAVGLAVALRRRQRRPVARRKRKLED